jgi:hypothetical protein
VREARGELEGRAHGDGPDVGRIWAATILVEDAQLEDAIKERQVVYVLDSEATSVVAAVHAVSWNVFGVVERLFTDADARLKPFVSAEEFQVFRGWFACQVLEVVQCVEKSVYLG